MPTDVTNFRWRSSNGGSFTKTVGGTPGAPVSAMRARPVVPELRSSTSTAVTSCPSTDENQGAVRSSTSTGSTGERLGAPTNFWRVGSARVNRQVVLAKRPVGMVTESCFETTEVPVPALGEGEALLEVRYLGIDPTIR